MKQLKQYQCDVCNTIYKSESECKNCEATHKKPQKIDKSYYNAYKSNGEYPKKIDIEFLDGSIGQYKFEGKIK